MTQGSLGAALFRVAGQAVSSHNFSDSVSALVQKYLNSDMSEARAAEHRAEVEALAAGFQGPAALASKREARAASFRAPRRYCFSGCGSLVFVVMLRWWKGQVEGV